MSLIFSCTAKVVFLAKKEVNREEVIRILKTEG